MQSSNVKPDLQKSTAPKWKQNDVTAVEKVSIPGQPSAFLGADVRTCGYELEDICGASSMVGAG
ncbi:hypothetical protein [Luteibacter sp. 3190]|uniref:hypothetical protein n=1 Tax=Luteibacter sp. 3190 TaxID=2817736 RepID=UPI00285D7305|nr:hypothetical protein [Luteibacter sp. 3190]MDR6935337.1 hypothetical protein [Luteibacter sp. 3190]